MKSQGTVKYFRSFSSSSYPITPLHEMDLRDARDLPTYYEARFDPRGLLRQFIKYLKQRRSETEEHWENVFTEEYEYFPTGRLKQRTLSSAGAESKTWSFDDNPSSSEYGDLFTRGFVSAVHESATDQMSAVDETRTSERLLVCHELLTEVENSVFESLARQQRSTDWILPTLAEHVSAFKEVVQLLCPESSPRLVFLGAESEPAGVGTTSVTGRTSQAELTGFDSLGGIVLLEDLLKRYLDPRITTPHLLPIETLQERDIKTWLVANEIAVWLMMPIRAGYQRKIEVAGSLNLVLSIECPERTLAALASALRRFGELCQLILIIAQDAEPIARI
jgi:hypothetical protein